VWEQVAGQRRVQSVTVYRNRVLERREGECDGVWEKFDGDSRRMSVTVNGERGGQIVRVFGNRLLEKRGDSVTMIGNRELERGEERL